MTGRTARKMQPQQCAWLQTATRGNCADVLRLEGMRRIHVLFTQATSFRARGYSSARVQKHAVQHGSSQPRDKVLRRLASVGKSSGVASR